MAEGGTDIVPFVTEITADMVNELVDRFAGYRDLAEPDRDAIVTAISKAAWDGILRGFALMAHGINAQEQARLDEDPDAEVLRIEPNLQVDPTDLWAERWGGEH